MSAIKYASTGKIVAYEISKSFKIDFVLKTVKQKEKLTKLICPFF